MDFLNSHNVLVLNSLWQPIGVTTPKKALVTLNSTLDDINPTAKAIDVVYETNDDYSLNLEKVINLNPLAFDEWIKVSIRPNIDKIIHTCRLQIRCPTVITTHFNKMPMRKIRPTKGVLYEMQGGRCGYTNEHISMKHGTIEHKIPKSFGGKNTFPNLIIVKKEINNKRGNKPLSEVGLKPLFEHKEPKPIPACYLIKKINHVDWQWFFDRE